MEPSRDQKIFVCLQEIFPGVNFSNSSNFIDDGLLDSFDVVSLTLALEERFQIKISGLDIVPENYSSIARLGELITKSAVAK